MKVYEYPERNIWPELLSRPTHEATHLNAVVAEVLADVKARGDQAVREYEERFDKVCLDSLAVTEEEMQEAELLVSEELKIHHEHVLDLRSLKIIRTLRG